MKIETKFEIGDLLACETMPGEYYIGRVTAIKTFNAKHGSHVIYELNNGKAEAHEQDVKKLNAKQ